MSAKPPKGHRATLSLLKHLVKVPKAELDALETKKAKQAKRKKK